MPFESSVAGSISKGPSDTVVRETTLLQTFEKIDPFTLSPNVFGGRRARKGFAFQDWWIAYTIVGLLLEPMGFSYARIEGVEDLDILTADPTGSVERYYQFKSKQEGTGTWTFVKLEEEKIFSRFIDLYLQFHSTSHDENRRIQFRVVLEGDLSKDVAVLQDENPSKSPLLFTLLATAILTRAKTIAPANQRVARDFFELAAQKSSESKSVSWFNELVSTLAKNFELKDNTIRESIIAACEAAYSQFPHFIRSIEIESRAQAPPGEQSRILEEAIIARLVRTADVSAAEAAEAVTKLVSCISHESSLSHATLVDRQLLLQWLGFEAVPSLQTKPALVADFVERTTFLSEVIASLQKHQSVCTYGISKMGKSQIASRLADATGYGVSYFWFAFSGTASDEMLFYRDLAVWVGKQYGVWQILEDFKKGRASIAVSRERVIEATKADCLLVLDDCHKCRDLSFVVSFISSVSTRCHIHVFLLSENKQPMLEVAGVIQLPIPGFEPKEVLEFVRQQGIDPRRAGLELITMSFQFGGHPLMLRAACQLLPACPSVTEVAAVTSRLPSATAAKSFLEVLSNHVFFELLQTPDQRALLSRLSVLPGLFDERVALALARVEPHLQISGADWTLISSLVLDMSAGNHCSFPATLKQVAERNLSAELSKEELLVAAATTQLSPAGPTKAIDFIDFQAGIFSFIVAKDYKAAARYLTIAVPKLYRLVDFEYLRTLFLILNGEPANTALESDFLRWHLAVAELLFRAKNTEAACAPEVANLFRRMRSIAHGRALDGWFLKFTILTLLVAIRLRRLASTKLPNPQAFARMTAPVLLAIKIATTHKATEQVSIGIRFFEALAPRLRINDIDVLKDAVLLLKETDGILPSPNALAELYGEFAVAKSRVIQKRETLRIHARDFKTAGFAPGYVAARYGEALVEHEHYNNYADARHILESLVEEEVRCARLVMDRINSLIADTYWAEGDYTKSTKSYAVALRGHHTRVIRQHIQERFIDSLISSGEFAQARAETLSIVRRRRATLSPTAKVHLYGRLAYACAESSELIKAAIASLALDRVARQSQQDELQCLSLLVAAWVLQHADFSDRLIPRPSIEIVNSSALSQKLSPEQLETWRKEDPISTKARMQIATVFELHGQYKRSAALFRQVLKAAEGSPQYSQYLHATSLRLLRQSLLAGKFVDATDIFIGLVGSSVDVDGFAPDIAAYGTWQALEDTLNRISDKALSEFSDQLFLSVSKWPQARAAVRLQQARSLFSRLLRSDARFRLAEAEDLAKKTLAEKTLGMIYQEKLFSQELYREWRFWFEETINACVELTQHYVSDATRRHFAGLVRSFIASNSRAFGSISANLEKYWATHAFEVAIAAVLRAAIQSGVETEAVTQLANWLRANVPFTLDVT